MRKNVLILLAILVLSGLCVRASVTPEELTDAEYVTNEGYSKKVAEDIFIEKNRVTGQPIEPLYERRASGNKCVNLWRKFWSNIDPALESSDSIHHDTNISPCMTDY